MTAHARIARALPRYVAPTGLTGYDAVVEALSPIGRWKLDDTTGASAAAAHGSAGAYVGTPTLAATGLISDGGKAVTLDGNTQEITVPTLPSGVGSLLFTFASTDASSSILFRDNTTTAGSFIQLGTTTTSPNVRLNNSNHTVVYNSNTLRNGSLHMGLLTLDGTNATLYIDGVQADQWASAATFASFAGPLHFGRNGTGTGTSNFYAATYDEIATFSAALTSTDATNLWAAR